MVFLARINFRSKLGEPNDSTDGCVKFFKLVFPRVVRALLLVEITFVVGTHKVDAGHCIATPSLCTFKITSHFGHDQWRAPSHHQMQTQSH